MTSKQKDRTEIASAPDHKASKPRHVRRSYRWLITIIVLALLVYVLAPQTDTLWRSLETLGQADLLPTFIAIVMTTLAYLLSAEVYHILAKHPVRLRTMNLVQLATGLTSRVAPIGIGTMGLNAYFLKKRGHTTSESLAVVALNNGLGIVGHFVLLSLIALTAPLPPTNLPDFSWDAAFWVLGAVALVVVVLAAAPTLRHKIGSGLHGLGSAVYSYRHQRKRLAGALTVSMVLSLVYVLALVAAAQALGIRLPFNQVFLIYSFSILTGIATPTPGGLVGVEAGLVGGFVAYGVAGETALAIALLYRLITYWLPLLPGFIAFRILQHRYL